MHYCVANMPGSVARTSTFAHDVTLPRSAAQAMRDNVPSACRPPPRRQPGIAPLPRGPRARRHRGCAQGWLSACSAHATKAAVTRSPLSQGRAMAGRLSSTETALAVRTQWSGGSDPRAELGGGHVLGRVVPTTPTENVKVAEVAPLPCLFKNAIFSIADEMALTVFRTTYSVPARTTWLFDRFAIQRQACCARPDAPSAGAERAMEESHAPLRRRHGAGRRLHHRRQLRAQMHLPDIFIFKPLSWGRAAFACTVSTAPRCCSRRRPSNSIRSMPKACAHRADEALRGRQVRQVHRGSAGAGVPRAASTWPRSSSPRSWRATDRSGPRNSISDEIID